MGGAEKKNGFDTQGWLAKGGNKFMALSENMAARCVMDHGASDGPTRGGTLAKRMGTQSPKEKGVIPAAKQMKPQKSGGSSVDSLILAEQEKKKCCPAQLLLTKTNADGQILIPTCATWKLCMSVWLGKVMN